MTEPENTLPAHSWPITDQERESIRFIEAWNARIEQSAAELEEKRQAPIVKRKSKP